MQTFDLLGFLERQKTFSLKAFGPHGRAIGILNHVKKEIKEIEADPTDPMEWIDVVLLSLDRLWRMGKTPAEIASLLDAKLTKNENREWPDWRTMSENDAIEHDRSGEGTHPEKSLAMTIVNQLFDRANVPVDLRQSINDECDAFVLLVLRAYLHSSNGSGIQAITQERREQIEKHGRSLINDIAINDEGQLAQCAKALITLPNQHCGGVDMPADWDDNICYKMSKKSYKERLIIAGALIAAEIDRINHHQ